MTDKLNLFDTVEQLLASGYIFRITDNGGASYDRFTIITTDGDYWGSSTGPSHPQGFFQSGEDIDVQGVAERVEEGKERDLRWIDLPEAVQRAVFNSINHGYEDFIAYIGGNIPDDRRDAKSQDSVYRLSERIGTGIYRKGDEFWIKRDDGDPEDDLGPYDFINAVRNTLPQDYDLSGPEYHSTVDITNTEGGAKPLWDCEETLDSEEEDD